MDKEDGNPNVIADITRHVLPFSRWKSSSVPRKIFQVLVSELSMIEYSESLVGFRAAELYRYLMKTAFRLMATQHELEGPKGEDR